jgi:threonine dehydrogenase-like Zn-dependent dehydrogenase
MRAAVLRGGRMVADTLPDPVPAAGQALVKSLACGICGTDLHAMHDGPHMMAQFRRAGVDRPLDFARDIVLGHEFCCEILDYGPDTPQPFRRGTHVTAFPTGIGLSNTLSGGFGELMLLDVTRLEPVTNGLPPHLAALTEPMAVGVHAVAKARLTQRDLPLVIGCGPVGLAVIAALKLQGAAGIVAADFSPARRALAARMGADVVVDPRMDTPYRHWHEIADADRDALVFECTGAAGVLQQILDGVPVNARIVMAGACPVTDRFEPLVGTLKEVNIQFAVAYTPAEFSRTLHDLCEGRLDVSAMVTARVGTADVARAMAELSDPERQVKIVVEPWR